MNWWLIYLAVLLFALALSSIITPICRSLAKKWNFLDHPLGEFHKRHDQAMPVLGGLAMVVSWTITILLGLYIIIAKPAILPENIQQILLGISNVQNKLIVIMSGGILFCLLGMYDDKKPIGPLKKLIAQLFICSFVAAYGVRISFFWHHPAITFSLTVFWLMFIVNAINFFDNMDGLAAGTAGIAAMLFLLAAGIREQYFVAILAAATSGVALGLYIYNSSPATIFMGDAGSHFLGYLLAVIGGLITYYKTDNTMTPFPVLIPLFVLALPIFDLLAVMFIRKKTNQPIYVGDHNHISHRFVSMGFQKGTAVFLVHLMSFTIGIGAIALLDASATQTLLLLAQALSLLIFVSILQTVKNKETKKS